jgi:hypothetical protein
MVLVRREAWFEHLTEKHAGIVDEGWNTRIDSHAVDDAIFLMEARNDALDDDVDLLIAEVRRLRAAGA